MIHDLHQLYEFGTDMQLITPNSELTRCLVHMKGLFLKSIGKSAGEWDEGREG